MIGNPQVRLMMRDQEPAFPHRIGNAPQLVNFERIRPDLGMVQAWRPSENAVTRDLATSLMGMNSCSIRPYSQVCRCR